MKKLLCAVIAMLTLISFAACSKDDKKEDDGTAVETKNYVTYDWPDNAFFKDIPSPGKDIKFYKESKNDEGYIYSFSVDDMDYEDFRKYIAKLEKAGFGFYDLSGLNITTTKDILPEELEDGNFNASWLGKRRGVYVATQWYGDEYYKENDLPEDSNVRLVFYTYDAFKK